MTDAAERAERGGRALAVSNGIAQLYREHFGRGPSRARTLVDGLYVVCFLADIFTPMERTLVEAGREDMVHATRRAFQQAKRQAYVDVVERILGVPVAAFVSEVHVAPDYGVEAFVLAQEPLTHEP